MTYEQLLMESDQEGLLTKEKDLLANKGRIKGNRIAIKKSMTQAEKGCVLAEELGHFHTTAGDIMDQNVFLNRKQERLARIWAYDKMIGLKGLTASFSHGCRTAPEICEFLNITEEFLADALSYYREKYGVCTRYLNYIIYFEPSLGIMELL